MTPEEHLDPAVTTRSGGIASESLRWIDATQPYPASGLRMSARAWDRLAEAEGAGFLARIRKRPAADPELVRLGLLDTMGAPTGHGREVLAIRSRPTLFLTATADGGGRSATWGGYFSRTRALVCAEPQNVSASSDIEHDGVLDVRLCSPSEALGLLAAWIGLHPVWTFSHEPHNGEYGVDEIERRIAAEGSVPPPLPAGSSWPVSNAWDAGQWTRIDYGVPRTGLQTKLIRAGDAAWFAPGPGRNDTVFLEPYAPSDILRDILALFQDSMAALSRN